MRHVAASAGRAVSRSTAALGLLALLLGVPVWLGWAIGWPLPTSVPTSWTGWQHILTASIPDTTILHLLALAGWLLWAAFARAVWIEAKAAWRGVHAPSRGSLAFHPLRALASFLIVTIAAGSIATTAATAQPASAAPATGPGTATISIVAAAPTRPSTTTVVEDPPQAVRMIPTAATARAPLLPAGPAVLVINGCGYEYDVQKGDSLWHIAEVCLGDGERWPEIWDLNEGRYWPAVSGYKHFTDPDLIYPRWTLTLPAGVTVPPGAPQVEPVDPPTPVTPPTATASTAPATPAPTTTPSTVPQTSIPPATVSTSPATAAPGPAISPPASTTPATPTPAATPTTTPEPTPTPTSTPNPAPSGSVPAPAADGDGVSLPDGSWVAWALAVAIIAAAAMVWLQRRRRYVPGTGDDDLTDHPAPVRQLQHVVRRNPDLPTPTGLVEAAAAVPPMETLPAGGIGLVGDAAAGAARAALVAVLASGGPRHPHDRGEVVIDAATLTTLIGSDAVTLGSWPRLHIADDVDDALTIIEARLLHRSRILDAHSLSDLDTLAAVAPDEEALPPMLLVCETPPAGSRMRAKVSFGLGGPLHVSALMLGEWEHGPTLDVATDGRTRVVSGQTDQALPDRMSVLEPAAAVQILLTLREAHTGQPPTLATRTAPPIPILITATPAAATEPPTDPPTADPADGEDAKQPATKAKARLRVLGSPGIDDVTRPGKALRAKALELAVYLACHPDGAATRQIGEYLSPEYRIKQADQQVHTNASNLRHVFGRAAGEREGGYVIKAVGDSMPRYRLDPDTVEADLWTLRTLVRGAALASGDKRRDLLRQACDLYTAPLADGCDYEWIGPHREAVRRWGTEAHLLYADALLDTDPQAASDLLDKAIGLDRHNEQLYVRAMHARHALRDRDGIRILKRALTKALADIDIEPTEETIALTTQLLASLDER